MFETREIFRHFPNWMEIVFYLAGFAAIGVFLYGFWRRYKKYKRGRAAERWNNIPGRFLKALGIMAKNSTVFKRDPYAGYAHWMIFWGFVVLFIGTCIIALDHDFLEAVFRIRLLQGPFYLWFSLIMDIAGVVFIVGLLMMIFRRGAMKLPQLDYTRVDMPAEKYSRKGYALDDKIFLWLLLLVAISGFFIEGLRIATDRQAENLSFEQWSPVGWLMAGLMDASGLTASGNTLHLATWWFHGIMVLGFVAYIPFSKAMHMLVDYANLMFKDDMAAKRLPRMTEEQAKSGMGYQKVEDFTWKEMLDFDACTKCGRCHIACPARASGKPLSPRDLILDLRTYADSTIGVKEWLTQSLVSPGTTGKKEPALAGGIIKKETLWACTTCMACVEACPVGIEHLTSIVQLRRALVDKGEMDNSLQDTLANIGEYGNSFGQPGRARGKWTQGLEFPVKDVRKEEAEYLWFVGDYASYDPRIQELTKRVANIFNKIGIDFGILYDGEKNAGNDVRRVGEEGLYEMLVEDNLAVMQKAKFKTIVTTDPHSFNTIKNEYPEFGGNYLIYHYTGLLAKMIDEGKLQFSKKLSDIKVTYHDPCYLGRYNGETDAPRKILKALGVDFHEMARCGANTFCCGAGGGRIWMDDSSGTERPSEQRIKEALGLGEMNYFVVACPKDHTMYSDAVKTSGNEGKIEVKDIIELVEMAI